MSRFCPPDESKSNTVFKLFFCSGLVSTNSLKKRSGAAKCPQCVDEGSFKYECRTFTLALFSHSCWWLLSLMLVYSPLSLLMILTRFGTVAAPSSGAAFFAQYKQNHNSLSNWCKRGSLQAKVFTQLSLILWQIAKTDKNHPVSISTAAIIGSRRHVKTQLGECLQPPDCQISLLCVGGELH